MHFTRFLALGAAVISPAMADQLVRRQTGGSPVFTNSTLSSNTTTSSTSLSSSISATLTSTTSSGLTSSSSSGSVSSTSSSSSSSISGIITSTTSSSSLTSSTTGVVISGTGTFSFSVTFAGARKRQAASYVGVGSDGASLVVGSNAATFNYNTAQYLMVGSEFVAGGQSGSNFAFALTPNQPSSPPPFTVNAAGVLTYPGEGFCSTNGVITVYSLTSGAPTNCAVITLTKVGAVLSTSTTNTNNGLITGTNNGWAAATGAPYNVWVGVTVTLSATFVYPCPTGWATSTAYILTSHCGCTQTPVPTAPAWTTVVTACPSSWGVGSTVTVTLPVTSGSGYASPTAPAWNSWAPSGTAPAQPWATTGAPSPPVATYKGNAQAMQVEGGLAGVIFAVMGFALL